MFKSSTLARRACGERRQLPRRRFPSRGHWLAVLAAGLALVWPTPGQADFMWKDPTWTVNKFDVIGGPGTTAQTTFGSLTADLANAGGAISASSDPNTVNSGGFLVVAFARRFRLFNDPDDSDVTLFGNLSGALNSTRESYRMAFTLSVDPSGLT